MSRLTKTFKALGILIRNPWKLNLVLNQNEEWERYIEKKYPFKHLPVIPFNSLVGNITVEPYAFLDGGSLPTDLALLKQLASDIDDCRYFEIGTWRGESAANVASSARVCYTLNLPENELKKYSDDRGFLASQGIFSKSLSNVHHLCGDSSIFDFASLQMKFDLVFIDGDHHYESVVSDTGKVLQHLCHENTVIVWHDYAYNPEQIRFEILAAILDACPADLHANIFHVENTNCAILLRKPVSTHIFQKYAVPDHYFSVNINNIRSNPK